MKKPANSRPAPPSPLPISSQNLPANILASAAARTFAEISASADALTPPPAVDALRLRREDLLGMESLLAALLRRVLPFATHSLYFPTPANTPDAPQWLSRERTLLLPLVRQGEVLGVFTARGVDGRATRRLLPELPAFVELCLDNLELERRGRCDALTGLALERELLGRMAREADMVRQRFSGGGDDMGPLHRACMGLVVVRCRDWHALAAKTSHAFAESLLVELSQALIRDLPPEALAARTGDDEFAVLLSAGSRGACHRLATALLPRLDAVSQPHPTTRHAVRICCSVGHALYPQDMDVARLLLPMEEQARTLLHKARLAATAAQERFDALLEQDAALGALHAEEGREARAMAFGRVLHEGGVIRRALPMSRVETSLGRHMGAYEGLRFAVWSQSAPPHAHMTHTNTAGGAAYPATAHASGASPQPPTGTRRCKGEIILVEVRETASVADIVHWTDPADSLDKGDVLTLFSQGAKQAQAQTSEEIPAHQAPHLLLQNGTPLNTGLSDKQASQQQAQQSGQESHKQLRAQPQAQSPEQSRAQHPKQSLEQSTEQPCKQQIKQSDKLPPTRASQLFAEAAHTPPLNATVPLPLTAPMTPAPVFANKAASPLTPEHTQGHTLPELLRHGDFVRQLGRHCEGRAAFSLVLIRLCNALLAPDDAGVSGSAFTRPHTGALNSQSDNLHDSPEKSFGNSSGISSKNSPDNSFDDNRHNSLDTPPATLESRMFLLHQLCHQHFTHEGAQLSPVLSAHYGQSSLIFLLSAAPAVSTKAAKAAKKACSAETAPTHSALTKLCRAAAAEGLDVAVGLAAWPHLRFTRADMPECSRKALDLALLLPEPRVGVFGSLALHISADKSYSRGDIFGAVEEYKLALLADSNNSMAWNSLGVCMAALARQQEARGHFLKALQGWKRALRTQSPPPFLPADTTLAAEFAATLYNLGTVCQALGERRTAARHFRQCVEMQPDHYFAHLRLGQLAEEGQRSSKAREHYTHALQLEDSGLQSGGMARRHLARLAVRGRKFSHARELLHEALRRDPHDAAAMGMLAELCLDGGEDPAMAEMLARNCVSLRGSHAPSWRLLARALRALDRHPEADAAEARAEAI